MSEEHVLIVEDEKKIADVLADYLKQSGFRTSSLSQGDQVIDKVKAATPALILLDLMLPGTDGVTICREIRKFSNVPIIMVTAKVDEVDRLIGLELGADDYICKPFSPREVVARVKAVLRRSQPSQKMDHIIVGPIALDKITRQVTVKEAPLNLTPSEFGLLDILIRHPERVFSRSELLDKVQGYRFEGYDRTIDSHIKNLRKKIALHLPHQEVIQTIYGIGYRFSI